MRNPIKLQKAPAHWRAGGVSKWKGNFQMATTSVTWIPVVRNCRCDVYAGGVRSYSRLFTAVPHRKDRLGSVRRGKIDGLSAASLRRLRDAILQSDVPGFAPFGLTLTLPGGKVPENVTEIFKKCLHHFGVAFRRSFPDGAILYRVELQERKAPHLHCIVWASPRRSPDYGPQTERPFPLRMDRFEFCPYVTSPVPLQNPVNPIDLHILEDSDAVFRLWFQVVINHWELCSEKEIFPFGLHGGLCTIFAADGGRQSAMRYLADDISRRKQAQLGYDGKQWGFIGKQNIKTLQPDFVLKGRDYYNMCKWIARIRGKKLFRSKCGKHCKGCNGWCLEKGRSYRIYGGHSYLLPRTLTSIKRFFTTERKETENDNEK